MVTQLVPCGMHTYDLGAMKKKLRIIFQKKGFVAYKTFNGDELEEMSQRYSSFKDSHTCDFTRKPRGIEENISNDFRAPTQTSGTST